MADAGDLKKEGNVESLASSRDRFAEKSEDERGRAEMGPSRGGQDPVEVALATALERASVSGEWGIVTQLARELETRRLARASGLVNLEAERRKRER